MIFERIDVRQAGKVKPILCVKCRMGFYRPEKVRFLRNLAGMSGDLLASHHFLNTAIQYPIYIHIHI